MLGRPSSPKLDRTPVDATVAIAIKNATLGGDVAALAQLVADHGPAVVRQDDLASEMTTLHWAAAAGSVEAVHYRLG